RPLRLQIRTPRQPLRREGHEAPINLACRQDDHEQPFTRLLRRRRPANLKEVAYVRSERTGDEHGEQFDAHQRGIGARPARVGEGIFAPEESAGVVAMFCAVASIAVAKPAWTGLGRKGGGMGVIGKRGSEGLVGEEGMVDEGSLEESVDQEVEGVPGVEAKGTVCGRGGQDAAGEGYCKDEKGERAEQRQDGCGRDQGSLVSSHLE
ncbi:MAG: hypothetical protein Q9173_007295, partial [Seirophora scorigena]